MSAGANLSDPAADDCAAELFARMVNTDAYWERAYPLVRDAVVPVAEPLPITLEAAGGVRIGTPIQAWDVLSALVSALRMPADFEPPQRGQG
jgi:hypothetical protein